MRNHKRSQKTPYKWKQKHNFPNLQTRQNLGLPQETRKDQIKQQPKSPSKRIKQNKQGPKSEERNNKV